MFLRWFLKLLEIVQAPPLSNCIILVKLLKRIWVLVILSLKWRNKCAYSWIIPLVKCDRSSNYLGIFLIQQSILSILPGVWRYQSPPWILIIMSYLRHTLKNLLSSFLLFELFFFFIITSQLASLKISPSSSVLCFIVQLYALILKSFHLRGKGKLLQSKKHLHIQWIQVSRLCCH